MLMRAFFKYPTVVLFLLMTIYETNASAYISEPIIEGKSIAGLEIGDTENSIYPIISRYALELVHTESNPITNEKVIKCSNMTEEGGIEIDICINKGKISSITLISIPINGKQFYTGKTMKGFSFGDSFQKIEELYGKYYKKRGPLRWYQKEGILFDAIGIEAEKPNLIIIMSPNSELDTCLKELGFTQIE
jgi:hypothetical protein